MYTVEKEKPCRCHPETCCCGDLGWRVMKTNKSYVWVTTENKADYIAKALNQYEGLSNG